MSLNYKSQKLSDLGMHFGRVVKRVDLLPNRWPLDHLSGVVALVKRGLVTNDLTAVLRLVQVPAIVVVA